MPGLLLIAALGTVTDGKTAFADIVAHGSYFLSNSEARGRFITNPYQLEEYVAPYQPSLHNANTNTIRLLTQIVTNGVISTCLSSSQCYLSCTEGDAKQFCAKDNPLSKSRFCPQPDVACQAQCWRPSLKAKNVAIYGMDQLENGLWNVRIEDILLQSYENYARNTIPGTAMPNVTEFLVNPLDSPERRAAGFRIPVCKSSLMQTGDFSKHGRKSRLFPCSCGDRYSSETAKFLAAAGFDTRSHKKELLHRCPKQLNKMVALPVEHYLALCALSVRWPNRWETRSIKDGADFSCPKVRQGVNDLVAEGKSWAAINRWFCTESAEGITVRREERNWISIPRLYGHDDKCKEFLVATAANS